MPWFVIKLSCSKKRAHIDLKAYGFSVCFQSCWVRMIIISLWKPASKHYIQFLYLNLTGQPAKYNNNNKNLHIWWTNILIILCNSTLSLPKEACAVLPAHSNPYIPIRSRLSAALLTPVSVPVPDKNSIRNPLPTWWFSLWFEYLSSLLN